MKKILCPTDFSPTATKALEYAIYIAKQSGGHLTVLHVVHLPIVDTSETALVAGELLGEQLRDAGERLKAQVMQIEERYGANRAGSFTCDYLLKEALLTDLTEHLTKNEGYDLVVMGTTGGGSALEELLIGSNTEAVVDEVKCTLLAVPAKAAAPDFSNIIYATDYADDDLNALRTVVELGSLFNSQIDMVHVVKETGVEENTRAERFLDSVKGTFPDVPLQMHVVENKRRDEGLSSYFTQHQGGVMAILRRHKGFFAELFSQSLADRMTYQAEIPLLILHDRK
ncbi:universal stress protein [Pontibacter sp. Tf4]|uniref:universal stress protein n=1 Tax=Pontibacter sp. Tf4 TaxID=2761620 RepID=UPI0016278F39|nr:universal stress protein [Pontibacter sp. Tf4]MBB6612483.1 universal stress protein [Pontibacter sp. Tf4]